MNLITLYPPEVRAHETVFHWHLQPPGALYRAPKFTLRFPDPVDLSRVPESLWWMVGLVCLHSQWPLLRPCSVRLPVTLPAGEAECSSRLIDAEIATLEAYRGTNNFARELKFWRMGLRLRLPLPLAGEGRCATAFSGGKDSLLQTGLLTELSRKPVLVTTTSPMPLLQDHLTPRRRHALHR
jgi:hypothetical protein